MSNRLLSSFVFLFIFSSQFAFTQEFIKPPTGKQYPIQMIDPLVHESSDHEAIGQFFRENGYVVIENVSQPENRTALVKLIDQIMEDNIPLSRRLGFMDLYHDDTLAQLRQDPRVYQVFAHLLGSEKLWVVFDRVIHQKTDEYEDPLPPHVDQNPITHPHFFNVQAMLALHDMNETTGTLAVIPQSPKFFQTYAKWTKPGDGYVEYQDDDLPSFVGLRLKEGEIVIWDSRTTHSRFRGTPENDRYAALVTFTLAKDDPELYALRLKYFNEGIGWNDHEAGLRATARPRLEQSLRHTPEKLTELGRKLYGLDRWE
jgi:ectoine hydroxylase-related dioxygenase (phytanoyl-CoA dioxygenase family)